VPERVATADSGDFDNEGGLRNLLSRALGGYPRDIVAIFLAVITAGAIFVNALYRQPGPHPAPIFAIKPRPVASEPAELVRTALPRARPEAAATQRAELPLAQKAEAPARPRIETVKVEAAPKAKVDPIAALIGAQPVPAGMPASRVVLVQRALNDFGYGPVKSSGNVGPDTTAAIQKFERERKLPVTGQISQRFLRDLAAVTGRQLD
jgi:hypothetical protein